MELFGSTSFRIFFFGVIGAIIILGATIGIVIWALLRNTKSKTPD